MPSTPRRSPALLLLALGLSLGAACQSHPNERAGSKLGESEPYVPLPPEGPQSIGFFLAQFERSLVQWSSYKLNASSPKDQSALQTLERDMQKRARKRRDELVAELENGVPMNRSVAAAALGFTHDATVLGPLLASLSDSDPEIVQKTLLGLGVLALPETPLGGILPLLRADPDAWTRNTAAFALLAIALAGNTSSELAEGCRLALADPEAGVRAQCASSLGVLADVGAVKLLGELLHDPTNLVALASATALARIGREHAEQKGATARELAGALEEVEADRRQHLLGALRWLSGDNFGEDAVPWLEWAHKLP